MNSRTRTEANGTARVIHDDCLNVLRAMKSGCVDMAYLDPPFATGQVMRGKKGKYRDQWKTTAEYMGFMRERVKEIHRVLKKHGVIFVHCDWRTCHHQRLMLDEIFGAEGFVNHLVWVYGLGGSSPRRFARKHDDVLFYAKGPKYFFKAPMVRATSQRMKGMMKKAIDVIEVASINNMARERTGYPTQKPVELMEVLVRACCPEGGMVMDPFCGSGSTLEAAVRNGRMCIGIDRNTSAVRITKRRLGL